MKSNLQPPCPKCALSGGAYQIIEGRGAMRCDCGRGALLTKGDEVRRLYRELDPDDITPEKPTPSAIRAVRQAAEALADIPGCPRDASAMTFLADDLLGMVRSAAQLTWLVRRARQLYRRWPGSRELRVLFCSRFLPKDGIEMSGSDVYPDGIPGEHRKEINWRQIEAGRVVSIDAALNQEITNAAKQRTLPGPKQTKVMP